MSPWDELQFRWPWRPYQQRVLDAVQDHLQDRRLHVVAAPGSGKTVLGIEAVRRLGRPALVLSPTRTIRDQWLTRLGDFRPRAADPADEVDVVPEWAGSELAPGRFFASLTYQALWSLARRSGVREPAGDGEELAEDKAASDEVDAQAPPSARALSSVAARIRDAGIETLVLDEAHHLTQAWWKVLSQLVDAIEELHVISLTGTPPFDTTGREWQRYQELCGTIDEEISIPELVRAGTLCPHQDYVHTSAPPAPLAAAIADFDRRVDALVDRLARDPLLLAAVEQHPFVRDEEPDADAVLRAPPLAAALLALCKSADRPLHEPLLELLDAGPRDVPPMSLPLWHELLAAYVLRKKSADWPLDDACEAHRRALVSELRNARMLHERKLWLERPRPLESRLSQSASKIDACVEIAGLEHAHRGAALRMVVLADFIRDDDFEREPAQAPELGAWPVFRAIARAQPALRVALLTGRLAIVPSDLANELAETSTDPVGPATLEPLSMLPGHARVRATGTLVRRFTELLARGRIQVLVGTRALLGEGWDAPCVNALVIASSAGSFVSTNQMRGRAIRIDRGDANKIASIWHLMALVPGTRSGVANASNVAQRFRTFVGLSADGERIESGIDRLALGPIATEADLQRANAAERERHARLDALAVRWQQALEAGEEQRVTPAARSERRLAVRSAVVTRTFAFALFELACAFAFELAEELVDLVLEDGVRGATYGLRGAIAAAALWILPEGYRTARLAWHHLPVDGSVRAIGDALLDALCELGDVATPRTELAVRTARDLRGGIRAEMEGGTFYEKSLFADCMAECLGPIENPRYLVTRSGRFDRHDFHAVPAPLARHRDRANVFLAAWQQRLGVSRLLYTRNAKGRRRLLRARARAFSSQQIPDSERLDRWS